MNRFKADFRVSANHPSLRGHLPGQPIVPGVLLLDHVIEVAEQATGRLVTGVRDVKFILVLRPDEEAHVLCEVDSKQVSFGVSVQRDCATLKVATGKLLLQANDRASA